MQFNDIGYIVHYNDYSHFRIDNIERKKQRDKMSVFNLFPYTYFLGLIFFCIVVHIDIFFKEK